MRDAEGSGFRRRNSELSEDACYSSATVAAVCAIVLQCAVLLALFIAAADVYKIFATCQKIALRKTRFYSHSLKWLFCRSTTV